MRRIAVNQYDLNGNYIQTFDSVKSATNAVSGQATNIVKALKGKIHSAYGYQWKYALWQSLVNFSTLITKQDKRISRRT